MAYEMAEDMCTMNDTDSDFSILSEILDAYQGPVTPGNYFTWEDENLGDHPTPKSSSNLQSDEEGFLDHTWTLDSIPYAEEESSIITVVPIAEQAEIPEPALETVPHVSNPLPLEEDISTRAESQTLSDDEAEERELDLLNSFDLMVLEGGVGDVVNVTWDEPISASKHPIWVLQKIDDLFGGFLEAVECKGKFVVKLRSWDRKNQEDSGELRCSWKTFSFPGTSVQEYCRFSALLRILELIAEAIKLDVIYTKRDIYYKDVKTFKTQDTVNRLIDDIIIALGVQRRTLHVAAAAKGLICGNLDIVRLDGSLIDCRPEGEGILIPSVADIRELRIGDAKFVLIIEKEAIFRTLAESGDWRRLPGKPILLCGKGYPDIATRELAHLLYITKTANGAFLGMHSLMDYDPHGLDIHAMYLKGSLLAKAGTNLNVPTLKHLGIQYSDILEYGATERKPDSQIKDDQGEGEALGGDESQRPRKRPKRTRQFFEDNSKGLLRMTERDRIKARTMLQKEDEEYADDLRNMLFLGYKAEIQILGDKLNDYLADKFWKLIQQIET